MFFATGTTRILTTVKADLSSSEQNYSPKSASPSLVSKSIVAVVKSRNANLFATATANSLYLWSSRPDVIISKVSRSSSTLEEDGINLDLIWKPDSSMIAVITDKGFLHFYDLVSNGFQVLYDYNFVSSHHYVIGAGERSGCPSTSLRFRMALQIDSGIRS